MGWKSMKNAFYGATNLTGTATDAPVWDPDVTEISFANAFRSAQKFNAPIGNWDTSKVTNMSSTFYFAKAFNQPIGSWVTDNVTNITSIFYYAEAFNQDINDWNVSNIKSMKDVFNSAIRFNKPLKKWDVSKVETMSGMFYNAKAFNQPIGNWDVRKVGNMYSMFGSANAFNQDIGSWQTNSLTKTWGMFFNAKAFNQYIGDWNTSLLYDSRDMFRNATSFNQPLTNWDTSKLQIASKMFNGATVFDQDISHFNIPVLREASGMLNDSGMSTEHYDALLNAWVGQPILKSNVAFGAVGINYCTAKPARDTLTNTYIWSITDAGSNCPPQNLSLSDTEVYENTTAVGQASAIDEGGITYTFVDGEGDEDNTQFDLDSSTGALSFITAPDYENPTDLGDTPGNNTYSIRVRATDETELYSEAIFIITVLDVDEIDPVITITAPIKSHNDDITGIIIQVVDNAEIDPSGISVSGSSIAGPENLVCQADGVNKVNYTVTVIQSGELIVRAEDEAGNSSSKSEDGFFIDRIAPVVSIDPPVAATISNQAEYTLAGGCTTGDKKPTITISSQSHTVDCIASRWTLTTDLSSYTDGDIAVSIQQTDAVGNIGTANDIIFKDTTAPTGTIYALRPTALTQPGFSGTVDDHVTISIQIDGKTYDAPNSGNGSWVLLPGTIDELAAGSYIVKVTFTDSFGHTSTETTDLTVLSKAIDLQNQADNQGTDNVVNQATIESVSGTCQAGILGANSLAGGLTAPDSRVTIIGGITYKLSCEELGGDATVEIILGEYYSDLSTLRIYKKQEDGLIDITSQVNLRNENNQTKLTITLIDGADYDEDGIENYEILDPLYLGAYREPISVPKTGLGRNFSPTIFIPVMIGIGLWLINKKIATSKKS